MVAVVSGTGLGLFNNSTAAGNSNVGRGRDQVFVNTTTGNLVVQSVDETLAALGLDFAAVRTYNSQGLADDDNGDQWRLGVHQRIQGLTGTVNTSGSTITKVFGDGAAVVYTWSTTRSRYESTDGDGANDFLTWNSGNSTWTWTDGSSRATEEYGSVNGVQRIRFSRDAEGNTVTYNYDSSSRLTSLAMAGSTAQTVYFDYTDSGAAANNLRAIRVVSNGVTQTLTRYFYDASNRLKQVVFDLTPENNSVTLPDANADGYIEAIPEQTYITTYTYDGTSKRIASIAQSDGSSVSFTYQNLGGEYRLYTVTDAENRVTTFTYSQVSGGGSTPVSAPANTAVLSNQDTTSHTRNDAALTTNATQSTPYTRNDSALSTTRTVPSTSTHNVLGGALTTSTGSAWGIPSALEAEPSGSTAGSPQVAFDSNGDGFAIWTVMQTSPSASYSLKVARYTRSTNSWATPATLYTSTSGPLPQASLAVDAGGNAIVAWLAGSQISAARYSGGSWSSAATLVSSGATLKPVVAIGGNFAAVIWGEGSALTRSAYVSRWTGTSWTSKTTVDNQSNAVSELSIAVDSLGNVGVAFRQILGSHSTSCVWTNQYRVSSGSWTGAVTRDPLDPAAYSPQIALDSSGNGFMSFAQGGNAYVLQYTRSSNTWSSPLALDSLSGDVAQTALAVGASGNGVLAWIQSSGGVNNVYAAVYDSATGSVSSPTLLETLGGAVTTGSLKVSMSGSYATAVWLQNDGTRDNAYAATWNGTAWSAATAIENSTDAPSAPAVAVDSLGNVSALWIQSNGTAPSVYTNRFASGSGAPYYTVPSGATWQSIANAVYGQNTAAAGAALQAALGNPALTTGAQLTGFPDPLTVTTTTTITVPAYYSVPAGATWQTIANAVYGINSAAAGSALQTALGNPALTTGAELTGFPATLSVTTTLAPHYLVPSGASWQSIASALFGSGANNSAGAAALQTALGNPSIAAGQRLYNIPATLSVTTTVPYYYTVQSGNTWSGITQSIYNTTDANAVSALQAAVGTSTLTAGARLTVPMTLAYTTGGSGGFYQRVEVQDALGRVTVQTKDSQGRLHSVIDPSGDETVYTYDPVTGNVATITIDPNGLNRVTYFTYDPNTGLLVNIRDSLGNTVARTYDANNQLLTEKRFVDRDPDGAGSGAPSNALTTRYVYDAGNKNRLRFVVSADGRVTEHVYDTGTGLRATTYVYASSLYSGSYDEASLNTWATNSARRGGPLERTSYTYDFRGNVSTITRWGTTDSSGAGTGPASTTRFVYDQRGLLLSTVEARGEATGTSNDYLTSYTYDGFGRHETTVAWVSGSETARQLETTTYDDANRKTVTTFANGLVKTLSFNRAGELTSVAHGPGGSLGTTNYTYDAAGRLRVVSDPTLLKTYHFYDLEGQLQGTVDGDGSLVEFIYNRADQLVKTVKYAKGLSTNTLGSLSGGAWSSIPFANLRTEANTQPGANQILRNVYDASGALVFAIDQIGAVTRFVYDGAGRLTDEIRHLDPVSIDPGVGEVLPASISVSAPAYDRRTRHFYNADGLEIGRLDGAGFLTENVYDAAGRLTKQIGYYNAVDLDRRGNSSIETMRPGSSGSAAQLDAARDIQTRIFYDAQGRKIGTVDGERYLTEHLYDVAGNVLSTIRYDGKLTSIAIDSSFATFKGATGGLPTHTTTYTYDGLGQVQTETNFENTPTGYTYDLAGNVTSVRVGSGANARTTAARYDLLNRITQELTAEGHAQLAALSNPTQDQIDTIWSKWGVTYTYDNAGRRTSATVRPDDLQTNTTYFYYDGDNRLRFELDARGRVTENRYNALGQLVERIEYHRTVSVAYIQSIAVPASGLLTDALIGALTATESANVHEKTTYGYSVRGEVTSTSTAAGATGSMTYNVFGELETRNAGSGFTAFEYTYDARGLQKLTKRGGTTFEDRSYDAFGRLSTVIDARGNTTTTTYDRLGREITTQQVGDANSTLVTYDAFSRVTSMRDKLLNTTSFEYLDSTFTLKVRTPENVEIVTVHNEHGEDASVSVRYVGAAAGTYNTTTYQYDKNGRLKSSSDNLGALEERGYDRAGRQVSATSARGTITTFAYDAANRLLTRIEDAASGGQQLVTTYSYDPLTRVVDVTEPGNRLTRTEYDRDGRVYRIIVDPNGATPSETRYTYDAANNVLTVTEGYGSAKPRRTQYVYDALGRRTDEYVDPTSLGGTLNLHTQYKYDNNGNVTRKIDAKNYPTWYVYDAQNRLTQTIDALGGVTSLTYDAQDRVVETRRHFTKAVLGDEPNTQGVTPTANDRVSRTVYDRDGRAKYSLDTLSVNGTEKAIVTERSFDAAGNVTRTRIYRNTINVPAFPVTTSGVAQALSEHADDRMEWTVYDLRGRPIYTIDGAGGVVKSTFDLSGNVIATIAYADRIALANLMPESTLTAFVSGAAGSNLKNRVTRFWYDTLDRARFSLDAEGYVVETKYLDSAKQEQTIVHANKPAIADNATLADVVSAVGGSVPNDQVTTKTFDVAGRVVQIKDANDKSEYFVYDAVGNKIRYVNKKASGPTDLAYTWIYEYDANGRLEYERSPNVSVATVNASTLAVSESTQQLVTHNFYDALGNVTSRVEAEGTPQARTTSYEYDELGRQTAVVSPTVGVYNPAGDGEWGAGGATVSRSEWQARIRSETSYDVFGNAFRNRVVLSTKASDPNEGLFTYKVYDNLGRVRYEIDAKKQITSYVYDSFGNKETVTRHAAPVTSALPKTGNSLTLSEVTFAANAATDRTITTTYDRLNRAIEIRQPQVRSFAPTPNGVSGPPYDGTPTTKNEYNAFGDLVRSQTQINSTDWATSYFYYDKLGRRTAELDAGRYLTEFEYDETGDLTRKVEYARPTTGTADFNSFGNRVYTHKDNAQPGSTASFAGYDRETTFGYDKLNRLISESRNNVEYSRIVAGVLETNFNGTQTTTYGYDVLGNKTLVRTTNPDDGSQINAYSFYDVLGRLVATAAPARNLGAGISKIAYTRMLRDAHGNLVQQIEFYNGLAGNYFGGSPVDAPALPTAPAADANNDRKTTIVVDAQGQALRTRDATGADRFASYDVRGNIAKEWQPVINPLSPTVSTDDRTETIVKLYRYDEVGQTIQVEESQRYNGANADTVIRVAEYNAFGEITYKYNLGTAEHEKQYFDYDQAGRVWRTNADDGVDKVYMYDLAGNATLELRSKDIDFSAGSAPGVRDTYASAQAVLNIGATSPGSLMRTETAYDAKGQVVQRRMPSFDIDSRYPPVATNININTIGGVPYVYWTAVNPSMGGLTFGYRIAGSGTSYTNLTIQSPSAGLQGVDVSLLTDRTYEFRLAATFAGETMPAAESTGTFRADRAIATSYIVTRTPPDPAAEISNLTIIPTAPMPANFSILQSTTYGQPAQGAQAQWYGANRVHGDWEDVGNIAVRVQVTYYKTYRDGGGQTSGTYTTWKDFAAGAARTVAEWTIVPSDESQASEGGIRSIVAMRVYAINSDGTTGALLRETNQGSQLNGLVWNAPADQTVTAYFRYKRTTDSTFSADVQATRIGTFFRVNVFPLLASEATYNYVIEYRRGSTVIAKNEGEISSGGQETTTTITGSISSSSFSTFNEYVASPSISGFTMSWAPPSQSVTASFEWGTSTAYGNTLGISQSSTWSVNLASIPMPSSTTTYYYRTVYRQGNRVVSQQTGTFSLTPPSSSVAAVASNDSAPAVVPPVSTVSGSSGVTTVTSVVNSSANYGVPSGAPPWTQPQWSGYNKVTATFADVGNRAVRVMLQYFQRVKNSTGPSSGAVTRTLDFPANGSRTQAEFQWGIVNGQADYEGVYSVASVRVYAINADGTTGALLRDSFASATTPEPPTISWARPADTTLVATLRIGGGSAVTPTLFAGRYQYSLAGIASNTFTIDYTRPGDSGPIVSLTGSFTNDGSNVEVTSQTAINRNPAWIGVSSSGATLSWSRAPESAGDVQFRYKVGGGSWQSLTPTGGPNYSVTFPSSVASGNYIYEVRYVRSGEVLPYVLSTGTVAVTVTNTAASAAFGTKSDSKYPAQQVVPSLSGNTVSWSFARENAGDTVTFRYSVGGNTYSTNLSGNGPSFSAVMSPLPVGTSTVNWWIEYRRAGETTFYASGSGTASMTHRQFTWPSPMTVLAQRAVYPSGVAEIPAPYNLSGGYLAWDAPANGATVAFRYNGTAATVEPYGSGGRVNLSSLDAGTYNYEITHTVNGVVTARAMGTFTVVKTPGAISSMTRTIAPQRVDTAMGFVPTIERTTVVWPPDAVYHEMYVPKYPTGDYVLVPGAKPWNESGGYRYVTYPSADDKRGTWERVNQQTYVYDENRLAITFPPFALGVDAKVEFWLLSNPGVVSTASVSNPNGNKFVADIAGANGIANGSYGYRISAIRKGSETPIGVLEGTFTIGSTNTITVTASPSPAPVVATPTTRQSYDRWGNVIQVIDAANNVTDYRYNAFDQLVQTLEAQDYVYDKRDAAGDKATKGINVRVEKTNSYDLLGRLIETQDGYDQASRVSYNAVGQQLTQRNADHATHGGALINNVYDIFGNLIETKDALGYLTRNKYDQLGRLTESWREIDLNVFQYKADATNLTATDSNKVQSQRYRYDEAGRRVWETNGKGEMVRYEYDLLGNVTSMRTPRGNTTSYVYNADGKKITETDALGSTMAWTYDAFGRLQTHRQLTNSVNYGINLDNDTSTNGGTLITYTYNYAGQLFTQKSNAGQDVTYAYDRGGNLASISDAGLNRQTLYRYDTAGRQSREIVVIDARLHQDTRITYDNHNRVKILDDPDYRERFLYDVNGNRAYVEANYSDHDRWMLYETYTYSYDEMNRVKSSSIFLRESQQYYLSEYTYNARGERVGQVAPGESWEAIGSNYRRGSAFYSRVGEAYTYDGLGRLTEVKRNLYQAAPTATQNPVNITVRKYKYDQANRQIEEEVYSVQSQTEFVKRFTTTNFDSDGRLNWRRTTKSTNGEDAVNESLITYGASTLSGSTWSIGFDAADNLRGYVVQFYNENGGEAYKTTYKSTYYLSDGYLESVQTATSSDGQSLPEPGRTQRFYNANHELTKFVDQEDSKKTRYFANNQAGQVLTTIRTDAANTTPYWDAAVVRQDVGNMIYAEHAQYFYYFQNNQVGSFGESKENGRYKAHFDVTSTPISESYPAAAPSSVIVQAGDTLRGIAARVFGDASLWYVLAEENGLADPDADLRDGMQLRVPNDVVSLSNTANSFKPFNIADALGDTTPTQPPPPAPKGGCGVIGMIIMIVVMVVVTIFTAGAAAAAMGAVVSGGGGMFATGLAAMGITGTLTATAGTLAAGIGIAATSVAAAAVGGAVGSAVSQGAGIAMGIQDKFDWKQVGMAAISSGFSAGMGAAAKAAADAGKITALSRVGDFMNKIGSVGRAAVGSAVTQGVAVATGLQSSFSWKQVAVAAISAPVSDAVATFAGASAASMGNGLSGFIGDFAGNVAAGYVDKAFGGKTTSQQILVDAFGNAMANSLTGQSRSYAGSESQSFRDRLGSAFEGFADRNFGVFADLTRNPRQILSWLGVKTPDERQSLAFRKAVQEVEEGLLLDLMAEEERSALTEGEFFETGGAKSKAAGTGGGVRLVVNENWQAALNGIPDVFGILDPYKGAMAAAQEMSDASARVQLSKAKDALRALGVEGVPEGFEKSWVTDSTGAAVAVNDYKATADKLNKLYGQYLEDQRLKETWGADYKSIRIGKSKMSVVDFENKVLTLQQRAVDTFYDEGVKAIASEKLKIVGDDYARTLGNYIDGNVRNELRQFARAEGIPDAYGSVVWAVNRRLYSDLQKGYGIPDNRLGQNLYVDSTLAWKTGRTDQVRWWNSLRPASAVVIIRPTRLGGSYVIPPQSILPYTPTPKVPVKPRT